jgi:hypothetical protein
MLFASGLKNPTPFAFSHSIFHLRPNRLAAFDLEGAADVERVQEGWLSDGNKA